jgi:hypothetical protein
MVGPIPFMKSGFQYGASTAREEALMRAQTKQEEQASTNNQHAGGSVTVPQVHTGAASDGMLNKNIAEANEVFMKQQEASKFDKLAVSNSITKGGRKRKAKKSAKKSKRKSTKKAKKPARKTRRKNK